jgi:bifunctional isochorismate lyase / aryl carrier protein
MAIASITPYELPANGSWPTCRAHWQLEPGRAALLVHDMQEYFLEPYDPDSAPLRPVLLHLGALRDACDASGVPVIFSAQPGEQSRAERGLLWDLWGPGIVERPALGALGLDPRGEDVMIAKRRYSAFHDTALSQLLAERGRDQLLITGVYAHIGCLATALDGFMRGIQPFVVADATADFSREDHLVALRQVARTCGVVTTAAAVLTELALTRLRAELSRLMGGPVTAIELDDDLADHGLDSVRGLELIERVLPRDHALGFDELVEARSLRVLARLMLPRAGSPSVSRTPGEEPDATSAIDR